MSEERRNQEAIAQSCRVRLARNYADVPFPSRMSEAQGQEIIERTARALEDEGLTLRRMADLSRNARGVLVEEHLISPELSAREGGAVLLSPDRTVAVMIGEEDHLRVQAMLPGLRVREAMALADRIDRAVERTERFAFDREWGYLTGDAAPAGACHAAAHGRGDPRRGAAGPYGARALRRGQRGKRRPLPAL